MISIDSSKCIRCEECIKDCVRRNLEMTESGIRAKAECLDCGHCFSICPVNAVSLNSPDYDESDVVDLTNHNPIDPDVLLEEIKSHRSIRRFCTDPITSEQLFYIMEAARYTATSKNSQTNKYVFVQDDLDTFKDLVYKSVGNVLDCDRKDLPKDMLPYVSFYNRKMANPDDDYLFKDAPAVFFVTSAWATDAELATKNIENMAFSLGLAVLHNGYLKKICNLDPELRNWLGIGDETIKTCFTIGKPAVSYYRSAPRKKANIIIK